MKLALVVHPERALATETAERLVAAVAARGGTVSAVPADADRISGAVADPDPVAGADVVVAVGGDGTVLEAVRLGVAADVPVVGINAGHVGFLAEIEPQLVEAALDAIQAGSFRESSRMTIEASLGDEPPFTGLNDVVVEKEDSQHVVRLGLVVDGSQLVEYRADALVVATPTGSTAYTFSAGGPLVAPELEVMVVTPVAPHSLFGRPMVVAGDSVVEVEVVGDRTARVNVDGRTLGLAVPGDRITVRRGSRAARLIRLEERNFVTAVKEKFDLDA